MDKDKRWECPECRAISARITQPCQRVEDDSVGESGIRNQLFPLGNDWRGRLMRHNLSLFLETKHIALAEALLMRSTRAICRLSAGEHAVCNGPRSVL